MNTIKPVIGIAFLLFLVYLASQLVPPFYHNYVFSDWVDEKAKEYTYAYAKDEDQIRQEVYKEAQKDGIPVTADQIQVEKTGTSCSIGMQYVVHVDLPIFPQDFHFVAASSNSSILTH
jgi:hypothetical protein